ncbi:MAG: DUF4837 family protein [Rhodothermaceae bacterium]|nr:DUF4837 family protein [Rhodothermaceae bacterium]
MRRPVLLAGLLAFLSLSLAACGPGASAPLPNAIGAPGEVMVVADSATWSGPVGDALRQTVGGSIAPPLDIPDFRLIRQNLTNEGFSSLRSFKNLIFAAPLNDTSAVARFLEARLDSAGVRLIRAGEGTVVLPRRDLWARNQVVVLAAAGTDSLLAEAIRARADTLRMAFTGPTLAQTEADMFSRNRQVLREDSLMAAHDFAVNVQHDYFVSQDTTLDVDGQTGQFVRIRRVLSDTWRDLFVYYEDGVSGVDSAHVERVTDAALEQFIRGAYDSSYVRIDRLRPIRMEPVTIAGRDATETRGLWRMVEDFMGGPFVRYHFYDAEQQRLYIVYGMVFAPQHQFRANKREFLRQLEVIARTFRTRADAAAEA